jgi:two-component system chemotaxis sensor kinase CheA
LAQWLNAGPIYGRQERGIMAIDRSRLLNVFALEAEEHLQRLNAGLLKLERGEANEDTLREIARAAHTVKGSARMVGANEISELAHRLEDLLGEIRSERIKVDSALCDLLFRTLDQMEACRQNLASGAKTVVDIAPTLKLLEQALRGEPFSLPSALPAPPPEPPEPSAAPAPQPEPAAPPVPQPEPAEPQHVTRDTQHEERVRVSTTRLDKTARLAGEVLAAQKRSERQVEQLRELKEQARDHRRHLQRLTQGTDDSWVETLLSEGETLSRRVEQLWKESRDDALELERTAIELQEDMLKLRMLPAATVFDTFPRAVRDLARAAGKDVRLVIEGGETEIDRQMLEKLRDPLTHMLRNAVDHGIESPAERLMAGKPSQGTVWLRAGGQGDSITLEVEDDGRGLDVKAIRERAIQKGVITGEQAATMSEQDFIGLIFLPGFSTSVKVTDVSGRGIGMDVVRKNIVGDLKGSLQVDPRPGQGARFLVKLPLTLTMMQVLFISVADQTYGLPVSSLCETLQLRPQDVIAFANRQATRLREQLIPLADLRNILGLPPREGAAHMLTAVVVQADQEQFGFVVDGIVAEDKVLIKSLPRHMHRIATVAGATITADGQIIPILYIPALSKIARGLPTAMPSAGPPSALAPRRILVVDDSLNTREIEKSILEAGGYTVDVAGDGLEALRKIGEIKYDLVVTDIEMPRLDGFELIARLRGDPLHEALPIIVVTSHEKEEEQQRGFALGADAYIIKADFEQSNLLATVESLIGAAEGS